MVKSSTYNFINAITIIIVVVIITVLPGGGINL